MPPRLARLLAAVVAVALVAGAFALRGALADDDEATTTGDGPTGTTEARGDDDRTYRVLCDEDLGEAACAAVADLPGVAEVEVRAAGEVLATAGDPDVPWDAWLTLDPMPGVLDTARGEAALEAVTGEAEPVASGPLAVLSFGASPVDCGTTVTWTCLLDQDVNPRVAIPSPDTSLGTLAIAAAATGLQGDTGYSIADYQRTDAADAVRTFVDRSPTAAGATSDRQTAAMLQPGAAAAAVTVEGLAALRADTVQGGNRGLEVLALDPGVVVGVVLAGLGPAGDDAVATLAPGLTDQTVREALAKGGWTEDPDRTSGLPAPDLVYALREELGR